MLQVLRIKLWSAAIAASADSFQPDNPGFGFLIAIAGAVLPALSQAVRRSLPASWPERCRAELRGLRTQLLPRHGAHQRNA
jgi:hypothetical protein